MSIESRSGTFTRDRTTWLLYGLLGYYAYGLYALGPLMPYLSSELGFTLTITSAHFSAQACGTILAGFFGGRVINRYGQRIASLIGGSGMACAFLLITVGRMTAATLLGSFLLGLTGALLLVLIQAAIADKYGIESPIALTEANLVASTFATLVPFIVGAFEQNGVGWRGALIVGMLGFIVVLLIAPRLSNRPALVANATSAVQARIPPLFYRYWLLVILLVSAEFCVAFWSAQFLNTIVHMAKAEAVSAGSLFLGAMAIGRLIGSRFSALQPPRRILWGALLITLIGFPLCWLSGAPLPSLIGLVITGLGIANFYPMVLSLALDAAGEHRTAASAQVTLASGLAVLTMPFVLGWLADHIGLFDAFGLVFVLVICAALLLASIRVSPIIATPVEHV